MVCEADVSKTRPKTGAEKVLQEQIDRGRERAQSGGPSWDLGENVGGSGGAGRQSGSKAEGEGLADVSQGVIIMDRGEDEEAAAETLGREMGSAGLGSELATEEEGAGLSRIDQIALMYQRKEMREGGSVGATREENNGAEAMDVDTQEGASSGTGTETEYVAAAPGAQAKEGARTQLERHDFAGLRDDIHSSGSRLEFVESPSDGHRLTSGKTGHTSASSNGKTSVEESRPGQPSGQLEAGGEPGPSSSGEKPRGNSGRCFYTDLPRLVKRKGMSATELTALNLDKVRVRF